MRQSTFVMTRAIAALLVGEALVFTAGGVQAQVDAAEPGGARLDAAHTIAPGGSAQESGTPPPALQLRSVVSRAWNDAIATWKRQLQSRSAEIGMIQLNYVSRLSPNNCYGLYAGEGPVYCSGNRTVFIGTKAANQLMLKFGPHAEAGITILIGHEIGHHVQNLDGRFRRLRRMIARTPANAADFVLRFELEADCLAGVWLHNSRGWGNSNRFKSDLLDAVKTMGDESVARWQPASGAPPVAIHGTSEQRARWFSRGFTSGNLHACNCFLAVNP